MSAGLIPLIRPAWPSERGRTRWNFSRASARSWGIGVIVEVGGSGLSSSRRNRSTCSAWRAM